MSDAPAVRAEGLTVRAGGKTLLEEAALSVGAGEFLLLAGPSGCGKSVLLKLLAGLVTPRTPNFAVSGRLSVLGVDVVASPGASRGRVGLVFQDFALFEGLTAAENVSFALDHRRPRVPRAERGPERDALLAELGLAPCEPVSQMSGGQRQRVAIARALAFAPAILAYDEPTSGLDPAMRDKVAERIGRTSREHGATTIVVTHDLAGLTGIADRVVLFDPDRRALVETPVAEAEERLRALEMPVPPAPVRVPVLRRVAALVAAFFGATGRAAESTALALLHLVPRWRSVRWGLRFLGHYLRAVAGPGALLYFLLAGAVIGLVSTYFTFTFLPRREFTDSLILDDLVAGLGFGLHRILVPLIMTLLLAARAGAAISADVATRVSGRQTDAMRTLSAAPDRYLLTGILWGFLLGTPILAFLSFVGARAASALVFSLMAPELSLWAWDGMFHRLLSEPGVLLPLGTGWVLAKDLTAAAGIAIIAWSAGSRTKESPEAVARTITATVIRATIFVLAVHVAFALAEF